MDLINTNVEEKYQKNRNSDNLFKLLMEWVKKQTNLPHITEYEAMLFLNATYQDLGQAKQLVTDYYTFRACNPEIFSNRNIFSNDIQIAKSKVMYVPLPGATKEGHNVLYGKITKQDSSEFDMIQLLKIYALSSDLWIRQKGITPGDVIVFDCHYCSIKHIDKVSDDSLIKAMTMLQDIFLGRLKGFYFINASLELEGIDKLLKLMEPFIKKDFKNIFQFHPTMETVFKIIPKEMFPNELGGSAGTCEELQEKFWEVLTNNANYFLEEGTKCLKDGCSK